MAKKPQRAFDERRKEPVIQRIFQLIEKRYSSRSEAANAWGMNINTLSNYYKRADQEPMPRSQQLKKIAEHEKVSLEWLLTGEGDGPEEPERTNMSNTDLKLMSMLTFLTDEEKRKLIEVLGRKGVETALYLLDEDNIALMRLDKVVKEKVLWKFTVSDEGEVNALEQEGRERVSAGTTGREQASNLKQDKKQAV